MKEACVSIWERVQPSHMPALDREICLNAEKDFSEKWNFPNCFACIDGKHIRIKCSAISGSFFYNYKHSHSIILQGVVDAKCRFRCTDVGAREAVMEEFSRSLCFTHVCNVTSHILASDQKLPE